MAWYPSCISESLARVAMAEIWRGVSESLAQLESDALDAEIQTLMAENAKLKCQAAQRAALAKPAVKPAAKRSGGTSKAGRQRSRFVP